MRRCCGTARCSAAMACSARPTGPRRSCSTTPPAPRCSREPTSTSTAAAAKATAWWSRPAACTPSWGASCRPHSSACTSPTPPSTTRPLGKPNCRRHCANCSSSADARWRRPRVQAATASTTTRPSSRRSVREACAACSGECVTITRVVPSALSSRSRRITSAPWALSRLPVGSSASTQAGRVTRARAMATRWRSPPESSAGRWFPRSPSPTRASISAAAARAVAEDWRRMRSGMATLSSALNSGSRWWNW
mmetsp:Transcript_9916/g.23227  ORF Transcript_9916/g.23227 Transcript_9916/m.23227 type:complete len:251 (-) Transcript_9916:3006-3758(-)